MTAPIWLYPMDSATFDEVSDKVAKRLSEYVKATYDYYVDHYPGITKKSGRERLAFYRTTDQAYWDRLAAHNMYWAKHNLMDWVALSRRYGGG